MLKSQMLVLLLLSLPPGLAASPRPALPVVQDPFVPGRIINPVTCKADASQSYALYIPLKGNRMAMPIVYFFDPHGDGSLPLKKYRLLAEAYGFIMAGSNNSRNGNDWAVTENSWRRLFEDTKNRLKVDPRRIYTCGFSGGAKVAGFIAMQHPGIKGVIANGAGLPDGTPAGDLHFSFTALAGEGDMNLTELVFFNDDLDRTRTRHCLIVFDGKHEWAPEGTMKTAFAGWQLDAMREGLLPKDPVFIRDYGAKSKARLAGHYKAGQLIKARQECQVSANFLEGLTDEASWFRQQAAGFPNNKRYQQQREEQDALLLRERQIKDDYMQHFRQGDESYWGGTIRDLRVGAASNKPERPMFQRLLAYLSLAFYSFSNRLIVANDNSQARHFVELYKLADPTNSEAWYFSAILHAREGQGAATEKDLYRAVENGFRDRDRLLRQGEFRNLPAPIHFAEIEAKIRAQER